MLLLFFYYSICYYGKKKSEIMIILLCIIVIIAIFVIVSYNRLVNLRNRVNNAWSQIDVQLQRRSIIIPNIVELQLVLLEKFIIRLSLHTVYRIVQVEAEEAFLEEAAAEAVKFNIN